MARQMLEHRQDAAGKEAFDHGLPEQSDQPGIGRERAIADRLGPTRQGQIEDRRAVDRDAKRHEIGSDQAGVQPSGLTPGVAVALGEHAEPARRRPWRPVRRPEARDPAAFLVDQNRRVRATDAGAQIGDQSPDLIRVGAVAAEQDEAPRIARLDQAPLLGAEGGSGDADDGRRDRPRLLSDG